MCKSNLDPVKVDLIANFLKDVKDPKTSFNTVIDKHLCVGSAKDRKASREALIMLLTPFRARLKNNSDNFRNSIDTYSSLPNSEKNINMDSNTENNTYCFKDNKGNKTFILIENGKIASFTVLRKGIRGVFLVFCG